MAVRRERDGIRATILCWVFLEHLRPLTLTDLARASGKKKQSIGRWVDEFKRASEFISVYLLQDAPANGATLGGAVLLYFIFLGFLSGLFLPAYFMQDFWDR